MYTRQERLNGDCTHREYFGQFVSGSTKSLVRDIITMKKLEAVGDKDSLNEIPLSQWDKAVSYMNWNNTKKKLKECGDFLTQAIAVCILKESAKQLLEDKGYDIRIEVVCRIKDLEDGLVLIQDQHQIEEILSTVGKSNLLDSVGCLFVEVSDGDYGKIYASDKYTPYLLDKVKLI